MNFQTKLNRPATESQIIEQVQNTQFNIMTTEPTITLSKPISTSASKIPAILAVSFSGFGLTSV
jgi:hypothetical protein